jgi:hypothetical protein
MTRPNITRRGMVGGIAAEVGLAAAAASGEIVSTAHGQSTPKTFVLVHGAWHGGWCWRRVSDLLERKGHKVFTPTLTGLGERSHLLGKRLERGFPRINRHDLAHQRGDVCRIVVLSDHVKVDTAHQQEHGPCPSGQCHEVFCGRLRDRRARDRRHLGRRLKASANIPAGVNSTISLG